MTTRWWGQHPGVISCQLRRRGYHLRPGGRAELMSDTDLPARIKSALSAVEIPGGADLAGYAGLSEIIVTPGAVAFAISVAQGMEAAFGPAREQAIAIAQREAPGR